MSLDEAPQLATGHPRIAIPCLRIEIRGGNDERDMRALGERLGYTVDKDLIALDPTVEWPLKTIVRTLALHPDAALIVPHLQHIDGLDAEVRLIAPIIVVAGERVLERAAMAGGATGQQS